MDVIHIVLLLLIPAMIYYTSFLPRASRSRSLKVVVLVLVVVVVLETLYENVSKQLVIVI